MKIIFAGTPAFAAVALAALIKSPYEVVAVYTQPDRPAGRGLKLTPSAVKNLALEHHLSVFQPASLKEASEQEQLKALNADVMVVAAYGLLLPQDVLDIPPLGCINIHPSLLPRWRGAAPIQRTIFAGDKMSGVSIMKMDAGLDTGPVFLQHQYALTKDETSSTLFDKLAKMGADSLIETLDVIASGKAAPKAQDNALSTYAAKITKEEALIDWSKPAHEIDCKIRAFNPAPMAYTNFNGERLRIGLSVIRHPDEFVARKRHDKEAPGMILAASGDGIDILTGDDKILTLLALQIPGGKMLPVKEFFNARKDEFAPGKSLT